jgi:pimeloyl-ACP methyl ester carboxylesterase
MSQPTRLWIVVAHLALVLPGGNNDPFTPSVLLPSLALEEVGAQVERVSYSGLRAEGLGLEESREFNAAVGSAVVDLLDRYDPATVTFVAKSRGALFLAAMEKTLVGRDTDVIWVTPLLGLEYVRAGVMDQGWPSLIVAGSADPYHDPAAHDEVCRAIGARSLVIEGAGHGLVVAGDVSATVDGFRRLGEASLSFVRRVRRGPRGSSA